MLGLFIFLNIFEGGGAWGRSIINFKPKEDVNLKNIYSLAGAKSSDNQPSVTSGDETAPGSVVHDVEMMDAMSGMMMGWARG